MDKLYHFVRGLLIIAASVALLGWILLTAYRRSEDRPRLLVQWLISAILIALIVLVVIPVALTAPMAGVPLLAGAAVVLGVIWAPSVGAALARPLTAIFDGGLAEDGPQPLYSIAEAQRKLGHYDQALAEVDAQLEQFPNDFPGIMMRAEILAESLHDVAGAVATLEQLFTEEGHAAKNLAYALNRLADWHLNLNHDAAAACRALERVIELFPETESAYLASQRLVRLHPVEPVAEPQERRPIPIPRHEEHLGLRPDFAGLKLPEENLEAVAASYVKRLDEFPADNEAREKLALLYASHFQRLDLAVEQFEQLMAQPGAPARQVARWLNTVADLQIKTGRDLAAAQRTLQRLVDRFPQSSDAEKARQRLLLLGLELKGQQAGTAVALGTYETNLGLKQGPPKRPGH